MREFAPSVLGWYLDAPSFLVFIVVLPQPALGRDLEPTKSSESSTLPVPLVSMKATGLTFSPLDRIHSWAKAHAFSHSLPSSRDPNNRPRSKPPPDEEAATSTAQHAQVNPSTGAPTANLGPSTENESEKPKPGPLVRMKNGSIRFVHHTKTALCHSWVNVLLVFVPVGIAVEAVGLNPAIIFAMNAVAIIPLAGLLSHATECVASRLGDTIGALINVTFGNAVELIIL